MKVSRIAVGMAVKAARDAAGMTLADLSAATHIPSSSLCRLENGIRSLEFTEALEMAKVLKIEIDSLIELARAFEAEGVAAKRMTARELKDDLVRLQRAAIEAAVAARAGVT